MLPTSSFNSRLDDVAQFEGEDLTPNLEFPFALRSKKKWSENALEEKGVAEQIILDANNPSLCPLLALAIHLEHSFRIGALDRNERLLFGYKKNF